MKNSDSDTIWEAIRAEVIEDSRSEPLLASFLHSTVLNHDSLESAISFNIANKLASPTLLAITLMELIGSVFTNDATIRESVRVDLQAVKDRDPACRGYSSALLWFKGFHALQSYRISHWLWTKNRVALALMLQGRISEVFGVDIHPAARIGKGILIDHATGIVVGETSVIKDNVSILHHVTLGGTGKDKGDRHPKIDEDVLISTGATILGNVRIGKGAKIGANSVVLSDVPPHCTAVGVPAKVCGHPRTNKPALFMNHDVAQNGNSN